jgi:hypothetical protein
MVSAAITANDWLTLQGVSVARQGSYHNNTNVRREADIDLRVVHPSLRVEYADNVHIPYANTALAYDDAPLTFDQIFTGLRTNLAANFRLRFGEPNVRVGNKAIRIKGVTGSRAEIDVVPAIRFHHVTWIDDASRYQRWEGVAILGRNGRWTRNFPEQHAANGKAKRARTANRFKKVVRIFKRLRADMTAHGAFQGNAPSFLVECLVYSVEDSYFLVESDDRYERVRRVTRRIAELLANEQAADRLTEINGLKWLFHNDQAWTRADARTFAGAASAYLG